jgi:hypothetical protein
MAHIRQSRPDYMTLTLRLQPLEKRLEVIPLGSVAGGRWGETRPSAFESSYKNVIRNRPYPKLLEITDTLLDRVPP